MGSRVHQSLYDKALDRLEQIVDADPDYELDSEQEFVDELSDSSLGGFTTSQVSKIDRLYRKYVLNEQEESDDDDE